MMDFAASSLERLDLLIAFLNQHFSDVELLSPEEMAVVRAKEEESVEVEDGEAEPSQPAAAVASLRVKLDEKEAFIPLDTMVS